MSLSKPATGKRKVDDDHRKFQERWELEYFFMEYRGSPTCLVCKCQLAVTKEFNIRRHYTTLHAEECRNYDGGEREKRVGELKKERTKELDEKNKSLLRQQTLFKNTTYVADKAVKASYTLSEMIAKAGKPFTEGEFVKDCMLKAASIVCPEKHAQFANISLSRNTVAERITDLSGNIYGQLREKVKDFVAYSVALDESTDITDTAQLAIFVRGVDDNFQVTEELLRVIPMHGQTTAQEIFNQLSDAMAGAGLSWKRLAGITTDGAPSMTGRKNGLVAHVQRKLEEEGVEEAIALHCIIHQQALACKCLKFQHVMSVVVKCINRIRSKGLKHRQFRAFLEEIESAYEDVLYFTEVRWLSRGTVLKRFFELRKEVEAFMEQDGTEVAELSDPKWLMDLAFLVDMTQELNVLNKKIQGPGQMVSAAYDSVKAFSTKLVLWKAQVSQKNLCHFPACKALADKGNPFSCDQYVDAIMKLQEEFEHRFADFKTHRSIFQIFANPFVVDVEDVPPLLQMELIDLQCSSDLKAKFMDVSGNVEKLGEFMRGLPRTFPELSRVFKRTMSLFGSTYLCEKLFPTMNFNKSKHRTRLSDAHLQAILRVSVSSLKPNVDELCGRKRCQVSGSKE
ncbi:general transcription factor II-I repeat domain-containing protein 2A-like [Diretmus argenteus]